MTDSGPLVHLTVVELAGEASAFCGKLLADYGARVIKVEPPGGDPARAAGPFRGDTPHPEGSLRFAGLNCGKQSAVIDLDTPAGRSVFLQLVRHADVLLDGWAPGELERRGLDRTMLAIANPDLVQASVTGFGLHGPHSSFLAPELVVFAMGGLLNISGDPARPPCVAPETQSYHVAGIHAAFGIMAALQARHHGHGGQCVEVAAQDCLAAQEHQVSRFSQDGHIVQREGSQHGGAAPGRIYPAADGFVHLFVTSTWPAFLEWMGSPPELADPVWNDNAFRRANIDVLDPLVAAFTRGETKDALAREGQALHIPVTPVNGPGDLLADEQLAALEAFATMDHPVLGRVPVPRAAGTSRRSGSPEPGPPLLGQHTQVVVGALRHEPPPRAPRTVPRPGGALAGIRVVDFTHMIAGPYGTQYLGAFGAEVIKVESARHPDGFRLSGYGVSGPGINAARSFAEFNRAKLGISVNMATPEGRDVVRRIIAKSDVVIENFSRGVMERWGMEYASLSRDRSDLIMVSMQGMGQRGPKRDYVTWGPSLMPYTGLTALWGHPDQDEPVGSQIAFPDYVVSVQAAFAILAAIEARRRTGTGRFIDLAQVAATVGLLPVTLLDYAVNHRVTPRRGNTHPEHAPHNLYPCAGEDRWCAIAVTNDAEWQRLCGAMSRPDLAADPRFDHAAGRVAHRATIDAAVAGWTAALTPHRVMELLQRCGVPAGAVQDARDLHHDPHLQARGMLQPSTHPVVPDLVFPGLAVRLDKTPGSLQRHAPLLGQDNHTVFHGLLGMDDAAIATLTERGVLT